MRWIRLFHAEIAAASRNACVLRVRGGAKDSTRGSEYWISLTVPFFWKLQSGLQASGGNRC